MIEKVISGGQTGADQAGLSVARNLSITTGGWATKGYRTSIGPNPDLLGNTFGLVEMPTESYKTRTWENVKDSDGTIRLCVDFTTPGEKCTANAIRTYKKPSYDVDLNDPALVDDVINWIRINNIKILNVAGNSQNTRGQDIFNLSYKYLFSLLSRIR